MRTMREVFEAVVDAPGSFWHGAEIISSYSRAQALEDGDLVDVSDDAREAGFKWPVAFTRPLYSAVSKIARGSTEDLKGRLWDVLSLLRMKARSGGDQVRFTVKFGGRNHQLLSVVGPGDTPEPVITVGYPGDF
jgi:hypothetical protein